MTDRDEVHSPLSNPQVSDNETQEKANKRKKIDGSEQAFDSIAKDYMEGKHSVESEWRVVKNRRIAGAKKQRDEAINKRRNIATSDSELEDAMEVEFNLESKSDAQTSDLLIKQAGLVSNSSKTNDRDTLTQETINKNDAVPDSCSRDSGMAGMPTDDQQDKEIFVVCGEDLEKKSTQQQARPVVTRYDDSFKGKAKITVKLPPDQTSPRKGKNCIKIWMALTDCGAGPETVVMLNHFSAEVVYGDFAAANDALERIEKLPEPKKIKAFMEQRAMISRGVISDWPSSIVNLWSVIQDRAGIIGFERMYRRRWNSEEKRSVQEKTDNIIVTFKGVGIRDLKIFSNNVGLKVRPFVPQTRQCFNCYRFGHTKISCKSCTHCIGCGEKAHGTCDKTIKCRNCGGPHKSTFKRPVFTKHKNINTVMAYNNVSFYIARRMVEGGDGAATPRSVLTRPEIWPNLPRGRSVSISETVGRVLPSGGGRLPDIFPTPRGEERVLCRRTVVDGHRDARGSVALPLQDYYSQFDPRAEDIRREKCGIVFAAARGETKRSREASPGTMDAGRPEDEVRRGWRSVKEAISDILQLIRRIPGAREILLDSIKNFHIAERGKQRDNHYEPGGRNGSESGQVMSDNEHEERGIPHLLQ